MITCRIVLTGMLSVLTCLGRAAEPLKIGIQRVGKPVMIGGADPQLTHMGNPWLFRCRPNDTYSARVIVDYGVHTLGKKKWAIVHSTDAYGTSGMKNLVEVLSAQGSNPC